MFRLANDWKHLIKRFLKFPTVWVQMGKIIQRLLPFTHSHTNACTHYLFIYYYFHNLPMHNYNGWVRYKGALLLCYWSVAEFLLPVLYLLLFFIKKDHHYSSVLDFCHLNSNNINPTRRCILWLHESTLSNSPSCYVEFFFLKTSFLAVV